MDIIPSLHPREALRHLLTVARDDRNSNELLGAALRMNMAALEALDDWLGTFAKAPKGLEI